MRRWLTLAAALAVVAVVVVGLLQAAGSTPERQEGPPFDLDRALASLDGSPPELARLHAGAGELVAASPEDFAQVLERLEGRPVVVNQWGSWCGPCRAEFPVLQRVSTRLGKRVAFVGINGMDPQGPAKAFLTDFPVPYPSYVDRSGFKLAKTITDGTYNYPTTFFVGRDGEFVYAEQGDYRRDRDLIADIERYLDV